MAFIEPSILRMVHCSILNVSGNYITIFNAVGNMSAKLRKIDIRLNPLKHVSYSSNFTDLQILTDAEFLCCLSSQFVCNKPPRSHICLNNLTQTFFVVKGEMSILIIALNIGFTGFRRSTVKLRSAIMIIRLLAVCNSLMGVSSFMGDSKDSTHVCTLSRWRKRGMVCASCWHPTILIDIFLLSFSFTFL